MHLDAEPHARFEGEYQSRIFACCMGCLTDNVVAVAKVAKIGERNKRSHQLGANGVFVRAHLQKGDLLPPATEPSPPAPETQTPRPEQLAPVPETSPQPESRQPSEQSMQPVPETPSPESPTPKPPSPQAPSANQTHPAPPPPPTPPSANVSGSRPNLYTPRAKVSGDRGDFRQSK